ncbi:hypothetical protein [Candidatus Binatus sp.]|uniref:hypothetical protein n=1 Tax=Candidatus Binatus sp. TaxID=2811406 RepID=UPI002F947333
MTAEDALRKITLLRKVNTNNGAVAAEVETARRLQKALMERYAIKSYDIPGASPATVSRLTWVYWQELLEEFGLPLNHFGNRGSAAVGSNKLYIRLDTNQWWIEEKFPAGWRTTVRNRGVEPLRKYLKENAPRSYSFFKR